MIDGWKLAGQPVFTKQRHLMERIVSHFIQTTNHRQEASRHRDEAPGCQPALLNACVFEGNRGHRALVGMRSGAFFGCSFFVLSFFVRNGSDKKCDDKKWRVIVKL